MSEVVIFNEGRGIIPGIPAKSVTVEEWETFPVELREKAVQSGLYTLPAETSETSGKPASAKKTIKE